MGVLTVSLYIAVSGSNWEGFNYDRSIENDVCMLHEEGWPDGTTTMPENHITLLLKEAPYF